MGHFFQQFWKLKFLEPSSWYNLACISKLFCDMNFLLQNLLEVHPKNSEVTAKRSADEKEVVSSYSNLYFSGIDISLGIIHLVILSHRPQQQWTIYIQLRFIFISGSIWNMWLFIFFLNNTLWIYKNTNARGGRCPYRGNVSALWASKGVHNKKKKKKKNHFHHEQFFSSDIITPKNMLKVIWICQGNWAQFFSLPIYTSMFCRLTLFL